ncbi:hypothetical protein BU23DRAFT_628829 [Bimuria novae-zelandiae CBS 107.79]|uniref:Xylanolytic transcriptional activator regulatory domain-containing protein n=1 Tax=Bimuria novae-zelandiae CBS 107.79 TaxID=1447943 RepID=A0A6A5UQG9_9PLEO|nr:hypothetical protein BU23DRAFT_628829 [Bimuria novae-zelandiae CBS 107.79]
MPFQCAPEASAQAHNIALVKRRRVREKSSRQVVHESFQHISKNIHPLYPFLDRQQIGSTALGPELERKLGSDSAWSVLFYAILALESQYCNGGSFQPANNVAWRLFSTAVALFPDLFITRTTLTIVQTITAMTIFASNVSCMQLKYTLVSEGVRKSQTLRYDRLSAPGHDARNRTFWVLFCLEKTVTFMMTKSSSIMDSDICSTAPKLVEMAPSKQSSTFFLAWIRLSRLLSRIYASLHSVSVRARSVYYFKSTINHLKNELENWRKSIPALYRPTSPIRGHDFQLAQRMSMCVRLHYGYHNIMLHLNRANLQLQHPDDNPEDIISDIMPHYGILNLSRILVAVPLAAFFVRFDLVVDNPTHPATSSNLALLDVGAGHFSRIEYA